VCDNCVRLSEAANVCLRTGISEIFATQFTSREVNQIAIESLFLIVDAPFLLFVCNQYLMRTHCDERFSACEKCNIDEDFFTFSYKSPRLGYEKEQLNIHY